LDAGHLVMQGTPASVTQYYLSSQTESQPEVWDLASGRRTGQTRRHANLRECKLTSPQKTDVWSLPYGAELALDVHVQVVQPLDYLELCVYVCTATSFELAGSSSGDRLKPTPIEPGDYIFRVRYPSLRLRPGRYYFGFGLRSQSGYEDYLPEAVYFDVLPSVESAKQNIQQRSGAVIPETECSLERFTLNSVPSKEDPAKLSQPRVTGQSMKDAVP